MTKRRSRVKELEIRYHGNRPYYCTGFWYDRDGYVSLEYREVSVAAPILPEIVEFVKKRFPTLAEKIFTAPALPCAISTQLLVATVAIYAFAYSGHRLNIEKLAAADLSVFDNLAEQLRDLVTMYHSGHINYFQLLEEFARKVQWHLSW